MAKLDQKNTGTDTKLHFRQTASRDGIIYDQEEMIAEIRNLELCNVKFRRGTAAVIGETVPMPLYWRQYANHQDPLRNAGIHGDVRPISQQDSHLRLQITGSNQDNSISSLFKLHITFDAALQSYIFAISAELRIPAGKFWHATYNSAHGELEFCNFWPEHCFEPAVPQRKKYQACYIQRSEKVSRIPHHHLDTSDKNNIHLKKGDRFSWLLEDQNPVVEIIAGANIEAGICAYMWDTHFACRVIPRSSSSKAITLTDQCFQAAFRLYAIDRQHAERVAKHADITNNQELLHHPLYLEGINTFANTLADFPEHAPHLWPWGFETTSDSSPSSIFIYDKSKGFDDHFSLAIFQKEGATSRWLATTIGPAFGQQDFVDAARYRLTAHICTANVRHAHIAIRLHRTGLGSVFDLSNYETFRSPQRLSGTNNWQKIELVTPPISPKPDRLHLILEQIGAGKSWFDNVVLEKLENGNEANI